MKTPRPRRRAALCLCLSLAAAQAVFARAPATNKCIVTDLGTLGGSSAVAQAVNASGQVTGSSHIAGDAAHRALRTAANRPIAATDGLGTLGGSCSSALAINYREAADSQVVGIATTASNAAFHAFLWTGSVAAGGTMVDLNSCIDRATGRKLVRARGISNRGQIVGDAKRNGAFRAVRLDLVDIAVQVSIGTLSEPANGLTAGQVLSLADKLTAACHSILQGSTRQATNQLNAYVNAVGNDVRNGRMEANTVARLIDAGKALLAIL